MLRSKPSILWSYARRLSSASLSFRSCGQVLFWMWGLAVTSARAKGTRGDLETPHLICGNLNKWFPREFSRGLWREPLDQWAPRNGLSQKWLCTSPIQLDENFWFHLLQSKDRTVGGAYCTSLSSFPCSFTSCFYLIWGRVSPRLGWARNHIF